MGVGGNLEYVGVIIGVCTCASAIVFGHRVCRCVCVLDQMCGSACSIYEHVSCVCNMDPTRSYLSKACKDFTAFVHPQALINGHPFSRHSPCVS